MAKICPMTKAGQQVETSLPAVEEEAVGVVWVVWVVDRAPVLTTPMLGAGRGNRDAGEVQVATKSPYLLTLPLVVVASVGEVVVGAPAVDEPILPLTVTRMVRKANETNEEKAKLAVAGHRDARVVRTIITTKKIMEMKSTATTVRVSMAQSTTVKVEAKRKEKEGRKDVPALSILVPLGSMLVVKGIQDSELGRKIHTAQKQNMTRKERLRAAGCEEVEDLMTLLTALMGALSLQGRQIRCRSTI